MDILSAFVSSAARDCRIQNIEPFGSYLLCSLVSTISNSGLHGLFQKGVTENARGYDAGLDEITTSAKVKLNTLAH